MWLPRREVGSARQLTPTSPHFHHPFSLQREKGFLLFSRPGCMEGPRRGWIPPITQQHPNLTPTQTAEHRSALSGGGVLTCTHLPLTFGLSGPPPFF